ncbi:MAG: M20 family metallopeptidase [Pseudodesulfovibrio sp.]|uniref:M20 family metallopeptidase n=1 Tax=Pseudodesulfovibrio sp. TaxID=2035812 RepID=UPI003D127A7F
MDVIDLARRLIRIDTTNPPGRERDALDLLAPLLSSGGARVTLDRFDEGRGSLVARFNAGHRAPALCFAGHIDTVPFGGQTWSHPPLGAEEEAGKIYGRGASDMKSGIAAMCIAALEMIAEGMDRELVLYVFGGEETGCTGSFHALADPDLLGEPGAVVVAEPTSCRPLLGHKGALWLRCTATGTTAHGAMPELGDNALYKAVDAIRAIRDIDWAVPDHAHLGPMTLSVNTLHSGLNTNSVPDRATFDIDMRTLPGQHGPDIVDRIIRASPPGTIAAQLLDIPAVWTEPSEPWIESAFQVLTPLLDAPPAIETVQFFTDAAAFRRALPDVPILVLGPGDPAMAHQTDEYCAIREIRQAVRLYKAIGAAWAAAPDNP